jgi:hypothetical protein
VDELSSRGVTATCVVIADDDNLDIAQEHGFEAIEMPNEPLGEKVNAGFELACREGADYVGFVGSDDWLHADLFQNLEGGIVSGRDMSVVDLETGRMRCYRSRARHGVIPWLIPSDILPAVEPLNRGLDYSIYRQIRKQPWVFHDPHPHTRVDFKSANNMTPFSVVHGAELDAWPELREWYPADLVDQAEAMCLATTRT